MPTKEEQITGGGGENEISNDDTDDNTTPDNDVEGEEVGNMADNAKMHWDGRINSDQLSKISFESNL